MASGKETPRQRMVGMMYLVLTALLALQVSSAMIYKFQALNESLEKTTDETSGWNGVKLGHISEQVEKRGKRPNEVILQNKANDISAQSKAMVAYIENIKNELIKVSGGYDEDGSLKGAKEETKVEVLMIGANKAGKAYALKKKLNEYVQYMNKNSGLKFNTMALDGKEDPMFKNNEEQKNKDFAELNFGQTPLVAGLAILSEFQAKVAGMEATSLTSISEKIGIRDFGVDKLQPIVSPTSRVVAAGTKYEAKLLLGATSSSIKPEMQFESKTIDVDNGGVGSVSFIASGGNYDPFGMQKKVWNGKITMKRSDGTDTTYLVQEEYYVAKPVIQVQAKAVQALYKNCGNKLNVQVPALGNSYNPRFTADGGTIITGSSKGQITIVPTSANVDLKVSNDGNTIGTEKFRVKLIPPPTIELRANGAKIDYVRGVDAGMFRSISVRAIADGDFAEFLPDDAIYNVSKVKVRIARGRTGQAPREFNTGSINLGTMAGDFKANDKLIVEVLEVKRRNFRGEWEVVKLPESQTTFLVPIN